MLMKMLLLRFYVKQQEVCLPLVHGFPVKLQDEVQLGSSIPTYMGFLPKQYCSSLKMLEIYNIVVIYNVVINKPVKNMK